MTQVAGSGGGWGGGRTPAEASHTSTQEGVVMTMQSEGTHEAALTIATTGILLSPGEVEMETVEDRLGI